MIFDGHSDILTDLTIRYDMGDLNPFIDRHAQALKKGGVAGAIFVIWPEPPHNVDPYSRTLDILNTVEKEVNKGSFQLVTNFDQLQAKWGKEFCVFLGAEGLSSIEKNPHYLDTLYNKGLRHASLTWNESNAFATGVTGDHDRGLTSMGESIVKRIEDLGILLDVSHLNEKSFWDLSKLVNKPLIASHSNLRKLSDHPRNLTDDQVRFIGESKGLIGINAYHEFVSRSKENQSIDGLVKHIVESCNLIGIDHVSLGFDFFGYLEGETVDSFSSDTPHIANFEDVSKAGNLLEILKQEFSLGEIRKICYENYFRVIKSVIG